MLIVFARLVIVLVCLSSRKCTSSICTRARTTAGNRGWPRANSSACCPTWRRSKYEGRTRTEVGLVMTDTPCLAPLSKLLLAIIIKTLTCHFFYPGFSRRWLFGRFLAADGPARRSRFASWLGGDVHVPRRIHRTVLRIVRARLPARAY